MIFKPAKLDTVAIVVTIIVTAFIVGLGILFIAKVPYGWIWAMAMLLIPGMCYALSPKMYRYDGVSIIIKKAVGTTITIPVKDIKGYTIIENLSRIRMTRTFGNGGLFGYYGMFSTAEYGPIHCQLTAMKNVVLIKTNTVLYAVSPDNVDGFVNILGAPGEPVQPIVQDDVRRASSWILMVPIGLYAVTIIVLVHAYQALPDTIAVHFDGMGNPDRWGSRLSFIWSTLIPASILAALGCGAFLVTRKTTRNPTLATFIVFIFAFIQVFTLYINMDMYWLNRYDVHIAPLIPVLVVFAGILIALLFMYYRIAVKKPQQ